MCSSDLEQNIDGLVANHQTDEKKGTRDEALRTSAWGGGGGVGYDLVTIKRVSSHMFCPILATK